MTTKGLDPAQVPAEWADVTPEWMTDAISVRHPGARVQEVELIMVDNGTNRRARFGLTYVEGSGPDVVFAKAEGDYRQAHALNGNMFNEPDLFASGVSLPVDHPLAYKVLIDRPALDYVIVMEDVVQRGADPRDATRPMTVDQVANGVRGLARLHSQYWGFSAHSYPELRWVQTWEATAGFASGLVARLPTGLERGAPVLPDPVLRLGARGIVDAWARSVNSLAHGPVTLLHGDPHIGNTYVLPDHDIGFLDWQVARRGNWSQDVGYFVVSALEVADRRDSEADLLEVYRRSLDVPDGECPSAEEAWLRYRAAPGYGLAVWLATLGSDTAQRREVCLALCERYAAAFVELDTLDALAALHV
ncbi:MAG TPA: phosphotransferase [Acidimicrobiales bacterium]|nr:phosphotransferase [Acidimicrobiales bacterium]